MRRASVMSCVGVLVCSLGMSRATHLVNPVDVRKPSADPVDDISLLQLKAQHTRLNASSVLRQSTSHCSLVELPAAPACFKGRKYLPFVGWQHITVDIFPGNAVHFLYHGYFGKQECGRGENGTTVTKRYSGEDIYLDKNVRGSLGYHWHRWPHCSNKGLENFIPQVITLCTSPTKTLMKMRIKGYLFRLRLIKDEACL